MHDALHGLTVVGDAQVVCSVGDVERCAPRCRHFLTLVCARCRVRFVASISHVGVRLVLTPPLGCSTLGCVGSGVGSYLWKDTSRWPSKGVSRAEGSWRRGVTPEWGATLTGFRPPHGGRLAARGSVSLLGWSLRCLDHDLGCLTPCAKMIVHHGSELWSGGSVPHKLVSYEGVVTRQVRSFDSGPFSVLMRAPSTVPGVSYRVGHEHMACRLSHVSTAM